MTFTWMYHKLSLSQYNKSDTIWIIALIPHEAQNISIKLLEKNSAEYHVLLITYIQ